MTVAYLLKKFPRTSETFILRELLGQQAEGTPLHVYSRRQPDDEPRHPELERLAVQPEYLPSIREIDPWAELFGSGGEFDEERIRTVARVVADLRSYGHPRFPSLLAEALWLRRRCAELDIRHVHVHFATDAAAVALLVRQLGGPGYSITMHAKDIYRNTVDPRLLRRMIDESAFCVTVCEANVEYVEELVGPTDRLRCLYNGIDLDEFPFRPEGRDEAHVLSVGRLVEKKGFTVLVDALARLRERGITCRATLVGEGDDRLAIEERIRERGLQDVIELTGALDQGQVRELLGSCTVFALPCVIGADGNRDALPTVLIEAMASGAPCVSTPVTGIPEILDGGAAGLLVPPHDAEQTASAIERLLTDPSLRREMADRGRRRAEAEFDIRGKASTLASWFATACQQGIGSCTSPA